MLPNSEKTRHNYRDLSWSDANGIFTGQRRAQPGRTKKTSTHSFLDCPQKVGNEPVPPAFQRSTPRGRPGFRSTIRFATGPKKSIRLYSPPLLTTQHKRPSFPNFLSMRLGSPRGGARGPGKLAAARKGAVWRPNSGRTAAAGETIRLPRKRPYRSVHRQRAAVGHDTTDKVITTICELRLEAFAGRTGRQAGWSQLARAVDEIPKRIKPCYVRFSWRWESAA